MNFSKLYRPLGEATWDSYVSVLLAEWNLVSHWLLLTNQKLEQKISYEIKKLQEQLGASEEDMEEFRRLLQLATNEDEGSRLG